MFVFAVAFGGIGAAAGGVLLYQLSRHARWEQHLALFMFALVFGALGIGAVTAPLGLLRTPASGPRIAAERGGYLFAGVFACWWNLLAWPLGLFALGAVARDVQVLPLAALLLFAAGLALASKAWRLAESRWRFGPAMLERLDGDGPRFKARIHVRPGTPMGVSLHQIEYTISIRKAQSISTVWHQDLGQHAAAPDAGCFELDARTPAWRRANDSARPAYWEVTLRSPGQLIVFRLAP
jgi:hypothetical protein